MSAILRLFTETYIPTYVCAPLAIIAAAVAMLR